VTRALSAVVFALLETAVRLVLVTVVLAAIALRLAIFAAVCVIAAGLGPWHDRAQPRPEIAIRLGL
jgi:hypothetical protein